MAQVDISFAPALVSQQTVDVAALTASTVDLIEFVVPGSRPNMFFLCKPSAALPAGVALGQPYCAVAGTVVVPFINATAGTPNPASMIYTIIAL